MIILTTLFALTGALANPLIIRQDAEASASTQTAIPATSSAATAIAPGQTPITQLPGAGSVSTSSAPNVTFWPFSEDGQSVTAYGTSRLGVDTYYGIPFAKPRECPSPSQLKYSRLSSERANRSRW